MATRNKHRKGKAARELDKSWEQLLAKHSKPLERGLKARPLKITGPFKTEKKNKQYQDLVRRAKARVAAKRQYEKEPEARLPSLVTPGGNASVKPIPKYTGTAIVGIATMHKSSMVPVFSQTEAIEIATMRRN